MSEPTSQTQIVSRLVQRLRNGEQEVRGELLKCASERLMHLTRKMKRDFGRLNRWEQTDDVMQNAMLRLHQSLEKVELNDTTHFFRLAATQIRRELIDMTRHYHGAEGIGKNHHTQFVADADDTVKNHALDPGEVSMDPQRMQEWAEFHSAIEGLPEKEHAVVDLLWYHGLSHEEAAELLNVSARQVRRYWRSAKLILHDKLHGEIPGLGS